MKWDEMTDIQQNALVAEKVMGWQWIPFDFDDAYPMKDQLWLLPDALSTHDLSPGEWTWYQEEEQVYPEGKLFPLPHKDNRIVPSWLPYYTKSMNDAWQIVEKLGENLDIRLYMEEGFSGKYCVNIWKRDGGRIVGHEHSNTSMPDAICKAALKACGVQVE
jgi:hypothetical protein